MARLKWYQNCGARIVEITAYMVIAAMVLLAFLYVTRSCDGPDPTPTPTPTEEATITPTATGTATREPATPTLSPTQTVGYTESPTITPAATDDKTPQPPIPTRTPTPCPWCYPWTGGCLCHQDVEYCLCGDSDNYCSSCEEAERDKSDKGSWTESDLSNTELGQQSIDPYPGPGYIPWWQVTKVNPYP